MPWAKLPGGGVVHLCIRGRGKRPNCSSCGGAGAALDCDGCDRPVCASCSVSPRDGLDFCPGCARPAFLFYLSNAGGRAIYQERGRPAGRVSFREWARGNADKFMELAHPRTKASLLAVPPTKEKP